MTSRFRFGPLERRGLLLGLRSPQLVILAGGAVTAVGVLRLAQGSGGILFAVTIVVASLMCCFVPIQGRALDEWLPLATRWSLRRLSGRNRVISPVPISGHDSNNLCAPLDGIVLLSHDIPGAPASIGVVKDRRRGTYTGVLAVKGSSFTLADPEEKSQRLTSWAGLLSSLARETGLVGRVQWVERTVPDTSDRVAEHLRDNVAVPLTSPLARSYLEVIDDAGPSTQEHEVFIALQIDAAGAARAVRSAGGGDEGACEVLRRELTSLSSGLIGSDVQVEGALTPRLLARALRTAFDPHAARVLSAIASRDPEREGTSTDNAGPMATDVEWARFRTDSAWHTTYWIAEWPRVNVDPDFMAPLLLRTTCTRTVAVTMQPISPSKAIRSVESARTSVTADEELRQRAGFLTTMRRQREHEALADNERDLTDGHAFYRFAGFVTVTGDTPEGLQEACGEVEEAAARSFLDLRPLYGEQDVAFTYTLPLCRGLR